MKNLTLVEARRLYALGFAIHWLRPNSKVPVEAGWTTGPRKKWGYLEKTYKPGFNVGVRLGTPSVLDGRYLAVVDVDVKSSDNRYLKEALGAVKGIIDKGHCPVVRSGRGNGSRHYYCSTIRPFKTYTPFRSEEVVRAFIPSKHPSKRELKELSAKDIKDGWRLSPAWEVSLYSDGRQVVLPPSIHPDSGKEYRWTRPLENTVLPVFKPDPGAGTALSDETVQSVHIPILEDFKVEPVDLGWLDIPDSVRAGIKDCKGVTDRSGYLMKAWSSLQAAGLTRNEILTILTDPENALGNCGYDHAQTRSRQRAAAWIWRYTGTTIQESSANNIFSRIPIPPPSEHKPDWREDLIQGKNGVLHLLQNVVTVLENAVPKDCIRRDDFAFRDAYSCDTPWGGKQGKHVEDDDVPRIKYWLGKKFHFEPSSTAISDALIVVATRNSFDPVKDFLDGLPEWDGSRRLDTWLKDYFDAEGDEDYLGQVFRKWMVAMVMRVYEPGAKFDWMPIFEGAQNIGKSSFGKILVGEEYFLDTLSNLGDKDSALALQGIWGVELGELSQFKKAELEVVKSYLSRTIDKVRPPYGRRVLEHARRCVFFGTTNRETYLIDETGNRRFKPIKVGKLNFMRLRQDRLQLFAEAKHLWDSKEETKISLGRLSEKAAIFEAKIHGEKMVADDADAMRDLMLDFVQKVNENQIKFDLEKFRIIDLFRGVGCLGGWRSDNRNHQFCAKMLKKLGAERRTIRGQRYWKMPG